MTILINDPETDDLAKSGQFDESKHPRDERGRFAAAEEWAGAHGFDRDVARTAASRAGAEWDRQLFDTNRNKDANRAAFEVFQSHMAGNDAKYRAFSSRLSALESRNKKEDVGEIFQLIAKLQPGNLSFNWPAAYEQNHDDERGPIRSKDRVAKSLAKFGQYDESKHPRGEHGRWASGSGSSGSSGWSTAGKVALGVAGAAAGAAAIHHLANNPELISDLQEHGSKQLDDAVASAKAIVDRAKGVDVGAAAESALRTVRNAGARAAHRAAGAAEGVVDAVKDIDVSGAVGSIRAKGQKLVDDVVDTAGAVDVNALADRAARGYRTVRNAGVRGAYRAMGAADRAMGAADRVRSAVDDFRNPKLALSEPGGDLLKSESQVPVQLEAIAKGVAASIDGALTEVKKALKLPDDADGELIKARDSSIIAAATGIEHAFGFGVQAGHAVSKTEDGAAISKAEAVAQILDSMEGLANAVALQGLGKSDDFASDLAIWRAGGLRLLNKAARMDEEEDSESSPDDETGECDENGKRLKKKGCRKENPDTLEMAASSGPLAKFDAVLAAIHSAANTLTAESLQKSWDPAPAAKVAIASRGLSEAFNDLHPDLGKALLGGAAAVFEAELGKAGRSISAANFARLQAIQQRLKEVDQEICDMTGLLDNESASDAPAGIGSNQDVIKTDALTPESRMALLKALR